MDHIKIEVTANEYQQEELIALLEDYAASGFEQTDEKLIAYFSEPDFVEKDVLLVVGSYSYTLSIVPAQNWNALWEENFQPVAVENFCGVRAHFHAPLSSVQHEIIITPKMSFGTGHHATTYMMMAQMKEINFKDKTVFDFGTGTGILAILAKKLGAASVHAIDVDEWSIENAKENIERNSCVGIGLELSTVIPSRSFDIFLANINRNVILDYLPIIQNTLLPASCLVLSGLLVTDEAEILAACDLHHLILRKRLEKSGWISLFLVNQQQP